MLKNVCFSAILILTGGLSAKTIGNVEFEFPPSNYEWKLFEYENSFNKFFDDDDDDFFDDEINETPNFAQLYTHREGDALEIFIAIQGEEDTDDEEDDVVEFFYDDDDDDEDEDLNDILESFASFQNHLDSNFNRYWSNHKIKVLSLKNSEDGNFAEWALYDGTNDIMHGSFRIIKNQGKITFLGYLTTALLTEQNRIIWTSLLNRARVIQ